MKTQIEEQLFNFGCLLALVGVCAFSYLAIFSHWTYSAAVAGLIGGWRLVCQVRMRRDHRRHLVALSAAFASSPFPLPRLKVGGSYGFRSFKLTFPSEVELTHAQESGYTAAFKEAIQSLYMHVGSKHNPFDADRAVWATYEGWEPHFTAL